MWISNIEKKKTNRHGGKKLDAKLFGRENGIKTSILFYYDFYLDNDA